MVIVYLVATGNTQQWLSKMSGNNMAQYKNGQISAHYGTQKGSGKNKVQTKHAKIIHRETTIGRIMAGKLVCEEN